jgi:hypothetical protein
MSIQLRNKELSELNSMSIEQQMLLAKQKLDMEIEDLAAKLNAMIFDLSQDHPDLVKQVTANHEQQKQESDEGSGKFRITDAEAKEIWRIIANTCHPDKNRRRDKRLHEIFLKAKTSKENGDMPSLYFAYLELVEYEKLNTPLAKLMQNSSIIKESLATLQARYEFLLKSPLTDIYRTYKNSRLIASYRYRQYLLNRMQGS